MAGLHPVSGGFDSPLGYQHGPFCQWQAAWFSARQRRFDSDMDYQHVPRVSRYDTTLSRWKNEFNSRWARHSSTGLRFRGAAPDKRGSEGSTPSRWTIHWEMADSVRQHAVNVPQGASPMLVRLQLSQPFKSSSRTACSRGADLGT